MNRGPATDLLDRLLPNPDIRERNEITIKAPAALVYDAARKTNFHSIPAGPAIFWLRGKILGAKATTTDWSRGFVEEALGMGWGVLAEERDRFLVAGAVCRPWVADVVFTPIQPDRFAGYSEPDLVKIVWTLEAEATGSVVTQFATETRAVGTDAQARAKFRRYWRLFGIGILGIRWMLLPAIRRDSERRLRLGGSRGS